MPTVPQPFGFAASEIRHLEDYKCSSTRTSPNVTQKLGWILDVLQDMPHRYRVVRISFLSIEPCGEEPRIDRGSLATCVFDGPDARLHAVGQESLLSCCAYELARRRTDIEDASGIEVLHQPLDSRRRLTFPHR